MKRRGFLAFLALVPLFAWAAKADRIISCAPNLTEILFEIGAGPSVVGVTKYCDYPGAARKLPKIGDLFAPNFEAMLAAQPDLIVTVPSNSKVRDYFASRPGVTVLETNACETLADIDATIRQLGEATGHMAEAERIIKRQHTGLETYRSAHPLRVSPRVLFVVGREAGTLNQLYAAGKGTYLDELLTLAGGTNVVEASLGRYPVLSRETLIAMDPDIIIESHPDAKLGEAATEMARTWSSLGTIQAVKHGRLSLLTDAHVMIPGCHLDSHVTKIGAMLDMGPPTRLPGS